ncbi:MAG: Mur ligase [Gammaproteobacteria bacterium]|nr:Mur ligase [Gammaproteobacteria bacterium]
MDILYPDSKKLILDDCRRLTGPSLVWDRPGAILDILVEDIPLHRVLDCWYRQLRDTLGVINWQHHQLNHRQFENGFNLVVEAPIDQLYSATLVLETAWYFTACELLSVEIEHKEILIGAIHESINDELNPELIALQRAAAKQQVDFLVDDDEVSIGHGNSSICFPIDQIPAPDEINWSAIDDLPVALITGTNGKSTSVRILDGIAKAAGQISGVTSTDFVRVGNDVLDQGDYSGPGGARLLLRDRRLQVAFLEVARGGILRRGLPLRRAKAALVTNVARDHLGQYGVNTLEALTEVKFVVGKALAEDGVLVVNADDSGMLAYLQTIETPNLSLFSLDKNHPAIQQQIKNNSLCGFYEDRQLVYFDGAKEITICAVADIPMTLGGAALHNISNALGAIGVAMAMGYSSQQVKAGLSEFCSNEHDNPGRLNRFKLKNGACVLIDFAHNAHSVTAVVGTVERIPARRKWALFGSAGDRSDDEISAIAAGICILQPDNVVITELEDHLRGRVSGEVSQILKQACLDSGLSEQQIDIVASPLVGVKQIVSKLQPDDLGLLLVLSERDVVIRFLGGC